MSHIVKILVPTNSTFQKMHAVKTRKMMLCTRDDSISFHGLLTRHPPPIISQIIKNTDHQNDFRSSSLYSLLFSRDHRIPSRVQLRDFCCA